MPKAFRRLTITPCPPPAPLPARAVICNHGCSALSPATYTNEQTPGPKPHREPEPPSVAGWGEKTPHLGFKLSLPLRVPREMLSREGPAATCSMSPP